MQLAWETFISKPKPMMQRSTTLLKTASPTGSQTTTTLTERGGTRLAYYFRHREIFHNGAYAREISAAVEFNILVSPLLAPTVASLSSLLWLRDSDAHSSNPAMLSWSTEGRSSQSDHSPSSSFRSGASRDLAAARNGRRSGRGGKPISSSMARLMASRPMSAPPAHTT